MAKWATVQVHCQSLLNSPPLSPFCWPFSYENCKNKSRWAEERQRNHIFKEQSMWCWGWVNKSPAATWLNINTEIFLKMLYWVQRNHFFMYQINIGKTCLLESKQGTQIYLCGATGKEKWISSSHLKFCPSMLRVISACLSPTIKHIKKNERQKDIHPKCFTQHHLNPP